MLEKNATASNEEKIVMQGRIEILEDQNRASKECHVFQEQEMANPKDDAMVHGLQHDTLVDATELLKDKIVVEKQDREDEFRQVRAKQELLEQKNQVLETKLETAGKCIQNLNTAAFGTKLELETWWRGS